jgi:hypoxanthine phosphoribosyltransferase
MTAVEESVRFHDAPNVSFAAMAQTTLFTRAQIDQRVAEMGKQITDDFRGEELIALCVLKGAVFFCTDLLRKLDLDVRLDFIQVSSYGNEKYSSGVVTVLKEPQLDMHNKNVLIVEDIIDSGLTINEIHRYIEGRGAARVATAAFLDKPAARRSEFKAEYVGYSIEPKFVVGYGLDFAEKYRNVAEVQVLSD